MVPILLVVVPLLALEVDDLSICDNKGNIWQNEWTYCSVMEQSSVEPSVMDQSSVKPSVMDQKEQKKQKKQKKQKTRLVQSRAAVALSIAKIMVRGFITFIGGLILSLVMCCIYEIVQKKTEKIKKTKKTKKTEKTKKTKKTSKTAKGTRQILSNTAKEKLTDYEIVD